MTMIFLIVSMLEINQGLIAAALGLAGVFAVLIIFYICTKIMLKIAINSNKKAAEKEAL